MAISEPIGDIITSVFTPSTGTTLYECVDDYPGTGDYIEGIGDDETLTVSFDMVPITNLPTSATLRIYVTASNAPFITLHSYSLKDIVSVMASDTGLAEPVNDSAHAIEIPLTINSIFVTGNTTLELQFNYLSGGPYGLAIYGIEIEWYYTPPPTINNKAAYLTLLSSWPH